ncbi:MAG: M43 family zinc metalloprotease [Bacteroidia bacterium]
MNTSYMRSIKTFISILLIAYGNLSAQQSLSPAPTEKCGFDAVHHNLMATDHAYRKNTEDFNAAWETAKLSGPTVQTTLYRIPVVVHVMYKGEAVGSGSNISEASINQGIRQLNERYRKVTGSLGDGNGVDMGIEFALAVRDPNGNCTNGIVRYDMSSHSDYMNYGVNSSNTNGMDEAVLKSLSRWDPTKYYNIYLVYEIDDNECGFGIQGYAYFASSHGSSIDGMIQLACKFAETGNTTLSHELGHSLNLYHTFEGDGTGSTCPTNNSCTADGDKCCDTPPHKRSTSNCVVAANTCDGGTSSDLFIHNYMDYSSDACQSEFTADQKARAVLALTTTRASFLEANGNMSLVPVASAGVDFTPSTYAVCLGNSVSFYDESTCIPNTYQNGGWTGISFAWTFNNGVNTPVTSTNQNPSITFVNAGTYSVTLAVTNSFGTTTLTQPNFITVSATPTAACVNGIQNSGYYGYAISNVQFNTISNSSNNTTNGYVDNSCGSTTLVTAGQTYTLSIAVEAQGSQTGIHAVYIDYNNNGTLNDAGETVMANGNLTAGNTATTFTTTVTIPGTATTNTLLRMRVINDQANLSGPCDNLFTGEAEDYGVYISSPCTAPAVTTHPSNSSISAGSNTTFSVVATNAVSYQWQVNTGSGYTNISNTGVYTNATTATLTITGATAGMNGYTYNCVVTGSCSPNATSNAATLTVSAGCTAPAITTHPSDKTICSGSNTTYSVAATNAVSYQWQVNTGSGFSNISNTGVYTTATTATLTISGATVSMNAYTYQCVVTGGCAPTATSNTASLTVNALPTVTANATATTVCSGTSITLTGGGATSYTWTGGITNGVAFTPGSTSTYTVTGTDANSCQNTAAKTITVNPLPTVTASATFSSVCAGASTTLSGGGATTYSWTGGITNGVAFVPASTTTYTVTGTNANGCSNTATKMITVNSIPTVTANATSSTVCSGSATTLSGGGASTYSWTGGVSNGVAFAPSATTTYTVTGTTAAGCSNTASKTITVNSSPTVSSSASPSTITAGSSSTLTASGATTYSWMPGSLSGASVSVSPASSTTYTVTGTAANGCTGLSTALVTVSGTSSVPSTKVRTADCGITLSSMSQIIYCDVVSGAVDYEWEFVNGATTLTKVRGSSSTNLVPSWVTGITNGLTYDVRVRAKVGSTWGNFNTICQISTLGTIGTTQLRNVDCGAALTSIQQIIYCNPVADASDYEWEWTEGGVTKTRMRGSANPNFNPIWVPGMQHNKTYDVRIRAYMGSTAGVYGTMCQVTIPVTGKLINPNLATETAITDEVSVIAYPNPTNSILTIAASENIKSISLYSLSGDLVIKDSPANEIDLTNFNNGAYILVVRTETTVKHIRILKQE